MQHFWLNNKFRTVATVHTDVTLQNGKNKERSIQESIEIKENLKTLENDYAIKLRQEIRKVENKYEDEIYHLEKEWDLEL